ncbi:MAG: hypothetical protein B7Z19_04630, partial [Polynucleobacter sp. 32-46-5]
MPLVAIAVGAIGSAVGTALAGTAIGGTLLGGAAAMLGTTVGVLGGVIGAGIAGGALAAATGGSFGKGFLMGAGGAALGGFLKAGLGDAVGATAEAGAGGMTEQAAMLAAQGGADFAPDALSGMGDLGATGATAGLGELGGAGTTSGVETFGLGETAVPVGTPIDSAATNSYGLGNLASDATQSATTQTGTSPFSLSTMGTDTGSMSATTPSFGGDQFSTTPEMTSSSPLLSSGTTATGTGGLDNVGQGYVQAPDGTTTAQMLQSQGGADFAPNNPPQGLGGTIKNMANTSDQWLKSTFGQGAPTTGKLLMAGGQALYDKYQIDKLQRQSQGLAPLSFEEYQRQFTNPDDYRTASRQLAQSGRTGTLPALLARMNERARQGYASYLPGAEQRYLGT